MKENISEQCSVYAWELMGPLDVRRSTWSAQVDRWVRKFGFGTWERKDLKNSELNIIWILCLSPQAGDLYEVQTPLTSPASLRQTSISLAHPWLPPSLLLLLLLLPFYLPGLPPTSSSSRPSHLLQFLPNRLIGLN